LIIAAHLLFWLISISCWNVVFNPGVENSGVIKGLQDYWPELLLLDFGFYLFCLMPFVWCIKKARKWFKITITVLFLVPVCYLIYEYLSPTQDREDLSLFTEFFVSQFMYVVVFHVTIMAAVYFNLKVLVDRYLKVSKFGLYLSMISALTVLTAIVNFGLFDYGVDLIFPKFYFISYFEIPELIVIVGGYLIFTTVVFLVWQYAVILIANRDKAQNELHALKAQINPHFLFNNLNTIYSMASKNDERTKEVILQLSDFLRYVLYDTASEFIPLEKETEIIKTYVELQKARVNPEITDIKLTIEGSFGNTQITPLLLLPLAENCFKHGIGNKPGSIRIHIRFKGKQLHFLTENPVSLRESGEVSETGGIGIRNVEKRLNLLYPGRHSFVFGDKDGIFRLELKIDL
jgi:hypothetical protein